MHQDQGVELLNIGKTKLKYSFAHSRKKNSKRQTSMEGLCEQVLCKDLVMDYASKVK